MRGNHPKAVLITSIIGTSPRMQGKPRWRAHLRHHPWNIPAYAGKQASADVSALGPRNIPACMRGKHPPGFELFPGAGNIPAYAGKTAFETLPMGFDREHPRARGENTHRPDRSRNCAQTSPRTRGKRVDRFVDSDLKRNIPAHAGKTHALHA